MVESFIREFSEYKKSIGENLPREMMHQAFSTIISHLKDSGKIAPEADKKTAGSINPYLTGLLDSPDTARASRTRSG
jgi:hypothetical protein